MLCERGFNGLGSALEVLLNKVMVLERADYLGAQPYQRSAQRRGYANGFKAKQFKTRVGELSLSMPQTREGEFYPNALEKGLRCERALKLARTEVYVQGVSTRKLGHVTEELWGLTLSSMQVSRAAKVLDDELECWRSRTLGSSWMRAMKRCVTAARGDCAVLNALGVDEHGNRDLLGCSVLLSEAEVHGRTFLQSLVTRGYGPFHLHQNPQSYVPCHDMKSDVALDLKAIFNAPNDQDARGLLQIFIMKYQKTAPKLAAWLTM